MSIHKVFSHNRSLILTLSVIIQLVAINLWASGRTNEIIAFGDSITAGVPYVQQPNGQRVGGYEPDLETLTNGIGDHYNVYNFGVGGETTEVGVARINSVISQHPSAKYLLLLEGTNDIWSGIPRSATVWNLWAMASKARNAGVEPVIGMLTPDPRPGPGSYKNVPLYNSMIRTMAQDNNIILAELYNEMVTDWVSVYTDDDLLHPNRIGYTKMAEVWFSTLFSCDDTYPDKYATMSECYNAGGLMFKGMCCADPPVLDGSYLLLLGN